MEETKNTIESEHSREEDGTRRKPHADLEGTGVLRDLPGALTEIAPEGSRALLIACEGKSEAAVREAIARKFRVSAVYPEKTSDGLKEFAKSVRPGEDVKLVIAAGDGELADAGKFVAARYGLPLCVAALSQADVNYHTFVSMLRGRDGTGKYRAVKPDLVLFDYSLYPDSDVRNAAAYGIACSRLISAFDAFATGLVSGRENEDSGFGIVAKSVAELLSADKPDKELTGKATARLSRACGENPRLSGGGAALAAEALEALKRSRNEIPKLRGENEVLTALPIVRLYAAFLSLLPTLPVAAPDGNLRLELMARIKISPFAAARAISDREELVGLERAAYILKEYRADLVSRCLIIEKTLVYSAKRIKRLYKDKGYSYNNYATASDVGLSLALATEMRGGDSLIKIIKQAGYLEGLVTGAARAFR